MSLPAPNEFSGHIHALLAWQPGERPLEEEVNDDLEGEHETIPNLTADDVEDFNNSTPGPFASTWWASIVSMSKGVTEKMDSEYQQWAFHWSPSCLLTCAPHSLAKQCCTFLLKHQLIKTTEEFLCSTPPNDADAFIISWIMNEYWFLFYMWKHCLWQPLRCDEIQLDGSHKPPGIICSKYTHAQKMHASMTHVFGHDFGLGSEKWHKSEQTGCMAGNPSVSTLLALYMVGLWNQKVCRLFFHWFHCSRDYFIGLCWWCGY